uniref:(California timema) hypothetical protein n=1 Tax=Timema californicum TaxID=61474 RepID=A0A7R9JC91_TIMCA|nr:unnamed protein product [Timema californicum]
MVNKLKSTHWIESRLLLSYTLFLWEQASQHSIVTRVEKKERERERNRIGSKQSLLSTVHRSGGLPMRKPDPSK